ncbi:MAG: hypothetical protein A2V64_06290, partial [Bacteroidetes bacterium RBG_13_43_22]
MTKFVQTINMVKKNILSILIALAIAYLSLSDADSFNKVSFLNFPGADKIVHSLMYFVFMSVIVFENRKNIGKTGILLLLALIPFGFGALMEILQIWLTVNRSGSAADLLFNMAGILLSVA